MIQLVVLVVFVSLLAASSLALAMLHERYEREEEVERLRFHERTVPLPATYEFVADPYDFEKEDAL